MKILNARQVKERMEANPSLHLVMTLKPRAFSQAHIPGSENIWDMEKALVALPRHAEIIVYCSDIHCMASYQAYHQLKQAGYSNVWRFAGGLREWHEAGYRLSQPAS